MCTVIECPKFALTSIPEFDAIWAEGKQFCTTLRCNQCSGRISSLALQVGLTYNEKNHKKIGA